MKKAIIFDVYGTLVSTGTGSVDATRKILEKHNITLDAKEVYSNWKKFHRKNVDEVNNSNEFKTEAEIFEQDLKMVYEMYNINEDYKEDVKIMLDSLYNRNAFEDTKSALEKLSKEYKIYIGSTTDTAPLMQNLKENNIELFDGIYTSESLKEYKPKKEFYVKILEEAGLNCDEVVFVGDSLNDDIYGPQSIGIYSILLDRKEKYSKESNVKPNAIIKSLEELPELMKSVD